MANPNPKHKFAPGNNANPSGRPKGSRNKLGEDFIKALSNDWADHGESALTACREKNPTAYIRVVAQLLPKELIIRDGNALGDALENLTDDQLAGVIAGLHALAGSAGHTGEQVSAEKPSSVH